MAELNQEHKKLIQHLKGIRYIVINTQYGGFSLSRKAVLRYLELSGTHYELQPQVDRDRQNKFGDIIMVNGQPFWEKTIPRDDPALIAVVRQLGSSADGDYATLKIIEIPADVNWYIEEYDGKEWVAETHRTWS